MMTLIIAEIVIYYLIFINLITFLVFGFDKMRAEHGWRRTPEAELLILAGMGGTPTAYAARALFPHKTRKQPFSDQLHTVAGVQLCVGVFIAVLTL